MDNHEYRPQAVSTGAEAPCFFCHRSPRDLIHAKPLLPNADNKIRVPVGFGQLVYDPDHFGGQYALATELTEGFDEIGDYSRLIRRK